MSDFELNITGDAPADELAKNSLNKDAAGGTELMLAELRDRLDPELWKTYNFMMSRVRDEWFDDRPAILWLQDLPEDPESQHLKDPKSRERFAKIIFNSNWQQFDYYQKLGIPYEEGIVLKNACEPFAPHEKPDGMVRLVYFSTPHRGLNILEAALRRLQDQRNDYVVDIYSSFEIYGWKERDKEFDEVYKNLRGLDHVTLHGSVPNSEIREMLKTSHILAYPSTYVESSCRVAIESMAAGLLAVVPNYGALTETCGDFAHMYNYESDPRRHAEVHAAVLNAAIDNVRTPFVKSVLKMQTSYYNHFYGWPMRVAQWTDLLTRLQP